MTRQQGARKTPPGNRFQGGLGSILVEPRNSVEDDIWSDHDHRSHHAPSEGSETAPVLARLGDSQMNNLDPTPASASSRDQQSENFQIWAQNNLHIPSVGLSSAHSSDVPDFRGQSFQMTLGELLANDPGIREAQTLSERMRTWTSFTRQEFRLRDFRMQADKYRRRALLKRREMMGQLALFLSTTPNFEDSPQVSRQRDSLQKLFVDLEDVENQLDDHEVRIIRAEWDVAQIMPQLLDAQSADQTFKVLVQNECHFPAEEEDGTKSTISSFNFVEELLDEGNLIASEVDTVNTIEAKVLELQGQALEVPLLSQNFEPSTSPLPPEQVAELQQLRHEWIKARLELENSRGSLQAPDEIEALFPSEKPRVVEDIGQEPLCTDLQNETSQKSQVFPMHVEDSSDGFPIYHAAEDEPRVIDYVNWWLLHQYRTSEYHFPFEMLTDADILATLQALSPLDLRSFSLQSWFSDQTNTYQGTLLTRFDYTGQRSLASTAGDPRISNAQTDLLPQMPAIYSQNVQTSLSALESTLSCHPRRPHSNV